MICFPHHAQGKFDSLKEAVRQLKKMENGWHDFTLSDIVRFNVDYRDRLRDSGIEALMRDLLQEVPSLSDDAAALNHLREWWKRQKRIAAYDVQCHHIRDEITVLGHIFKGLKDVVTHREISGKEFYSGFRWHIPKEAEGYADVHIGEIYECYPVFDSFDLGDDRTYRNYFFRRNPISEADMEEASGTIRGCNFCMVHENIPPKRLPVLYYPGEGDYMLLATSKEEWKP